MGALIQWDDTSGTTNFLTFDVTMEEDHEGGVNVTEHPVEKGADVADNVRPLLDKVTLQVFVSNTPISPNEKTSGVSYTSLDLSDYLPKDDPFALPSLPPALVAKLWERPLPLLGFEVDMPFLGPTPLAKTKYGAISAQQVTQWASDFDAVQATLDILRTLRDTAQLVSCVTSKHTYDNMVIESFQLTRGPEDGTGGSFTIGLKQLRLVETVSVNAPQPQVLRGNTGVSKGTKGTKDKPTDKSSLFYSLLHGQGAF